MPKSEAEGSGGEHKYRTPSFALVPPSAYPMRGRSPLPCAQPSPRRDAPSPFAFAKSCKGGDVSVRDPALAWDVRFIYLFSALVGLDSACVSVSRALNKQKSLPVFSSFIVIGTLLSISIGISYVPLCVITRTLTDACV